MKIFNGWYFPDTEKHFIEFMSEKNISSYQTEIRNSSFKFLDNNRSAIDIGANVGLWARDICDKFKHAYLYEPFHENVECLRANLLSYSNYTIHECALSNETNDDFLYFNKASLGGNSLNPKGFVDSDRIKIRKKKLDEFNLKNIDYIKIDVQFHELEVIEGALDTLVKNNPVLCIEAARRNEEELTYVKKIVKLLENIDYKVVGGLGKELFFKK